MIPLNFNPLIYIFVSIFLMSCSQSREGTEIKVTTSFGIGAAGFLGGLTVNAVSGKESYSANAVDGTTVVLPLTNGDWTIKVVGWNGPGYFEGQAYCGSAALNLTSTSKDISINVSTENCSRSEFGQKFRPLKIYTCSSLIDSQGAPITSSTSPELFETAFCNNNQPAQYLKLRIPKTTVSGIAFPGIESSCLVTNGDPLATFSLPLKTIPFVITLSDKSDCTQGVEYSFLSGLSSISGTKSILNILPSTSNALFLNYAGGTLPTNSTPTILSVSGPSAGIYLNGNPLTFNVTFSEAVSIVGSPRIPLVIGSTTVYGTANSASLSPTHTFTFVTDTSNDEDELQVLSPIELNGGSIQSINGVNAILTFSSFLTSGIIVNPIPLMPSGVSLFSPSTPDFTPNIMIEVSGVTIGDTVTLYMDSGCTSLVASGVASTSTINLAVNGLADNIYFFYAKATNPSSISSPCSTVSALYRKISCPPEYLEVGSNQLFVAEPFCVMKYEAKNQSSIPVSQPTGIPWGSITAPNARTACSNLGLNYDLISNQEWMAIAYEIEANPMNWTGGSVGIGQIYRGHSDSTPSSSLDVANISDPYIGTGNTAGQPVGSGKEQKRVLQLANGSEIWDFAGNAAEWTDWVPFGAFDAGPTTCTSAELPAVSCGQLNPNDYMPSNPGGISMMNYDSSYGLGSIIGGAGGAAARGGGYTNGVTAGIFFLQLNTTVSSLVANIGFRCVHRP